MQLYEILQQLWEQVEENKLQPTNEEIEVATEILRRYPDNTLTNEGDSSSDRPESIRNRS